MKKKMYKKLIMHEHRTYIFLPRKQKLYQIEQSSNSTKITIDNSKKKSPSRPPTISISIIRLQLPGAGSAAALFSGGSL